MLKILRAVFGTQITAPSIAQAPLQHTTAPHARTDAPVAPAAKRAATPRLCQFSFVLCVFLHTVSVNRDMHGISMLSILKFFLQCPLTKSSFDDVHLHSPLGCNHTQRRNCKWRTVRALRTFTLNPIRFGPTQNKWNCSYECLIN